MCVGVCLLYHFLHIFLFWNAWSAAKYMCCPGLVPLKLQQRSPRQICRCQRPPHVFLQPSSHLEIQWSVVPVEVESHPERRCQTLTTDTSIDTVIPCNSCKQCFLMFLKLRFFLGKTCLALELLLIGQLRDKELAVAVQASGNHTIIKALLF